TIGARSFTPQGAVVATPSLPSIRRSARIGGSLVAHLRGAAQAARSGTAPALPAQRPFESVGGEFVGFARSGHGHRREQFLRVDRLGEVEREARFEYAPTIGGHDERRQGDDRGLFTPFALEGAGERVAVLLR